jgi:uncharacterized coiled-coil protein SlyX
LELERQKSATLAEKLQDETDTRSRLEREIDDKNAKIVQLNEEIEQLKKNSLGIVPAEDALEKALDGYNDLVSSQQTQGGETNSALDQIEKVFQRFKEAQRNLNEHVEGLVLDQKTEIDSEYVQDRDQCVQELREKIEKGMKILDREVSQYERNKKWAELFQRAQQHSIDHEQRAGDSSKRLEELNGRRQELADSIVASLRRFDTNKVTLDQLSQTLKASEKELNKHAKEVRNLKNQVADLDDTASHDSTVSAVADLDQAKLKRDQVLHHTEQLRSEVAQKSAEQDSLPEYRLLAPPKKLKTHSSFLSTSFTSFSSGSPMTRESPFMETSFKDYVVDRELTLNKEGQARVYVCNPNKELNTQVVVKVYQLHSNADTENGIAECNVIRGIDSRNVYKLLDCFPWKHDKLGNVFCVVQPYYSEGDLRDLNEKSMRHGKFTPNDVVLRVAYQVLSALKLIHERGIMHGDLKPHNIFVAPDGRSVVVTEFGINKARLGVINKDTVVDYYAAPEAKRKPGPAGDIWALGCILYEMMSLKRRNMAYEQLYAIADNELAQFQEEIKQDMQQVWLECVTNICRVVYTAKS